MGSLSLYLNKGIYGFLMPPVLDKVDSHSKHYNALADYACTRKGMHVMFFLRRRLVYGGEIIGSENRGAFFLNGPHSPMGKKANSDVCWDESQRTIYRATAKKGVFEVPKKGKRCQPYIIRFEDKHGLKGRAISSDQLFSELGKYGYPLPSNSISGMGFCTLTPGETDVALSLFKGSPIGTIRAETRDEVTIRGKLMAFKPEYGVVDLKEAFRSNSFVNEAHLEASVLANPDLLPERLRPPRNATLCRQVPISPFKPANMDRADICYYYEHGIRNGTIPNVLIELKVARAGKAAVKQLERYLTWLERILGRDFSVIQVFLLAPSLSCSKSSLLKRFQERVQFVELSANSYQRRLG
jgi:RecB family endonuclease NucS